MRLFVNSLEGKVAAYFFDLPPKILYTWEELDYWFKSAYGQPKIPVDQLKEYKNTVYNNSETIKSNSWIDSPLKPSCIHALLQYFTLFLSS